MQLTIQITNDKMVHTKPAQFGAIVAHVMKSKHFAHVLVYKTMIAVTFNVSQFGTICEIEKQGPALEADVIALLDLEPFPCPCGCGQFLAIGSCLEQSGELFRHGDLELTEAEKDLVHGRNKIGAIKMVRERLRTVNPDGTKNILSLREAKDIVDKYEASLIPNIFDDKRLDTPPSKL